MKQPFPRKIIFLFLLILLILLLYIPISGQNSSKNNFSLTLQEKQWIKKNPKVVLGADFRWPPFDFADKKGNHSGIASDYVKELERITGLTITVETGVWADIMQRAKDGTIDGLTCAVKTRERSKYFLFTKPYLTVPTVIICRKESTIHSIKDLFGKKVSINKGSYMHEWLAERYPEIKLHLSSSNQASLEAVSYGSVDAYIGNLAATTYILRKKLLTNLKVAQRIDEMNTETSIAIVKSKPILMSILQKGLDSIPESKQLEIMKTWYIASSASGINLTEAETEYLKKHPVVSITGATTWAPFSYVRKGTLQGMVIDYMKLIEDRSGLKFQTVVPKNWNHAMEMVKRGDVILLNGIDPNGGRKKDMDFTIVYLKVDIVLVSRNTINYITELNNENDLKLGTIKGYITVDHLRRDYPRRKLYIFEDERQGLKALASGKIDLFTIDVPTYEHYMNESSLVNLKISGLTPYSYFIAIGVSKGNRELISILNKSISLISQKEMKGIYNKWITINKPLIDYSIAWKLAAVALVIILLFAYWNRRLSREISRRKAAELEAKKASRAKSDFLANMSHEIRTPMNSVLGFAELLETMITDPQQKNYLKSIRQGGTALLDIINDILDLSKIEAGKMTLHPQAVSLKKLVDEMKDLFAKRIDQKGLSYITFIPEDFPQYISIDRTRIRQIVVNLLGNAVKFTEEGFISLEVVPINVNELEGTISFTITVSDTGIGIPEEDQKTIFEKFEQQDGHDHARFGGTGLGLAICKSLSQLMDISIHLKSIVAEGSSFILELKDVPVVSEPETGHSEMAISNIVFSPANILVADDLDANRTLLKGILADTPLSIDEATNGREVLEKLRANEYDIVFMDLRMPVMSGYEAVSIIKHDPKLMDIPVIAFTASVMGEDMEKVHQYGFDGYLRKPVTRQDVFASAARHLFFTVEPGNPLEEMDISTHDIDEESLRLFLTDVDPELFEKWRFVKDRGDFSLTEEFVQQLKDSSNRADLKIMIDYSEKLYHGIESFDILEVESLMKQFPLLISSLKKELEVRGRSNE